MTFGRPPALTTRLRQRGQAVIWLLGTMAATVAVLYGVFNVGQLHAAKEKTVNAADAAALAGATVEARMLNLIAYNNRSMMANEVLLIQMLSIESWLGYFHQMSQNIGLILDLIPGLDVIGAFLTESSTIATELQTGVNEANNIIIPVLELAKKGFAAEHLVLHTLGGVVAENAATNIVAANRSTFSTHTDAGVAIDNSAAVRALTFTLNEQQWLAFSKRYTDNQRTDAKEVLLASRDDFSANRPGNAVFNFSALVFGLEKKGGSQLQGFTRWESEDTLELWEWTGKKHYQPVGWGRANADYDGTSGSTWSPNRLAQDFAYGDGSSHSHTGWTGVPSVYDIADKKAADRTTLGMDFVVAVKRSQAATMTSSNMGMGLAMRSPTGSVEMPERLAQDQLNALAKARVSFERPQRIAADRTASTLWRTDSAKEYGSLFSPYWQARLVDFGRVEKAALLGAMGIDPAFVLVTPGAQ